MGQEPKKMHKKLREYAFIPEVSAGMYESDPTQLSLDTATVWVLHLKCPPSAAPLVLERLAQIPDTTGEYLDGDSWVEWGEEPADEDDHHLAIYYRARNYGRARSVGEHLRTHAQSACLRAGIDLSFPDTDYAISTAGDFAEQIKD